MTRILVPTGIGDIYWVLVKLQSFLKKRGIVDKPKITILGNGDESCLRSLPLLEMIPFVSIGDPVSFPLDSIEPRPFSMEKIYRESFVEFGRTVYPGLHGYDYFICYNGVINSGHWLDDCDDLECNWHFDLTISKQQEQFRELCIKKYGKYAVFYWTFNGNYIDYQLAQFPLERIAEAICQICCKTNLTPVFIGAWWDLMYNDFLARLISLVPGAINLVGKTSLDKAFGVIKGSEMVLGYHSGITNMAVVLGKKTILLWPSALPFGHRFKASVPLAVAPPETRNNTYRPMFTDGLTADKLVKKAIELHRETI
jgi:hypothetical protein